MAHNKLYRNFIILQEDEKANASSDEKALSGYAKIEARSDKCKISFYAQNLNKEDTYSMVLICYKKDMKQIVDLGSLSVNEVGKADDCKEYYINNIAGLNFSYEKISGAAICKNDGGHLTFLMYGFMNSENVGDGWKKCKIVKFSNEDIVENELKQIDKVNKKEEKKKDIKVKEKDHHNDEHKDDKNQDVIEKKDNYKNDNCDEKVCNKMCDDRTGKEVDFDAYESKIEENKEINPYDFEMRGPIGDFFTGIVDDFEEIKNKFKEIKYCKWYKVNINDIDEMCNVSNYNKYTIAYYPMLNYYPYIRKYGYFLLGYKCDDKGEIKYIVYGVPGKKDRDEQPYAGKTGFVTWMKTDDDMGCWLMFYDYKNSTVVVPMK